MGTWRSFSYKKCRVLLLLLGPMLYSAVWSQDIAPSAWQRESAGWKPFLSDLGKFQVLVPGEMTERVDSLETPVGKLFQHSFLCKDGADLVYIVDYVDYPELSLPGDSLDLLKDFLQATVEEEVQVSGGELVFEESADILGYPGKIWRINVPASRSVIRSRAFIAGDRFYALRAIASKAKALNPSGDRFLNSFRLLR